MFLSNQPIRLREQELEDPRNSAAQHEDEEQAGDGSGRNPRDTALNGTHRFGLADLDSPHHAGQAEEAGIRA